MTAYLTLTLGHQLAPIAWRLHREGIESAFVPWRTRAERCWVAHTLPSPVPLEQSRHEPRTTQVRAALAPWLERAQAGDLTILWDTPQWGAIVQGAPSQWGTHPVGGALGPIRLGAWYADGRMQAPHLLWVSQGAWPGGLGAAVEGGMTLVRPRTLPDPWKELLEAAQAPAEAVQHQGLVQIGLGWQDGVWRATGAALGWHGLHVHAFLAALGEEAQLGKILAGDAPTFPHRFAVVVPVSVPPWPVDGNVRPAEAQVQGLDEEAMGRVFWHDVAVDEGARVLKVAGVDGMVGVARGVGESRLLAQARAVGLAGAMQVPEKQFRGDVGGVWVEEGLAQMEAAGLEV